MQLQDFVERQTAFGNSKHQVSTEEWMREKRGIRRITSLVLTTRDDVFCSWLCPTLTGRRMILIPDTLNWCCLMPSGAVTTTEPREW
jgi:hypothetical protein